MDKNVVNTMPDNKNELKVKQLESENELLLQQLCQVENELARHFSASKQKQQQPAKSELACSAESSRPNSIAARPVMDANAPLMETKAPLSLASLFPKKISDFLGLTIKFQIVAIRRSGLFDEKWYSREYPDVAKAGIEPIRHYLRYGAREARNPSPKFDTRWYLEAYPDVAGSKLNPLLHYIHFGRFENRQPQRVMAKQAIRTKDEQARISAEPQRQVEQITQHREQQAKFELVSKAMEEQASLAAKRQKEIVRLTGSRDEQAKLASERQSKLEVVGKVMEEQVSLAAERQKQIVQLTESREEQAKLASERQARLEVVSKAMEEQVSLAAERQKQIVQLTESRDELAKLTGEQQALLVVHQQKIEQQTRSLDEQSRLVAQLRQELNEARQTASLSIKLQTLREADLKDLQDRYKDSLSKQEEQYQLLTKLGERLGVVSNYFHQISSSDGGCLPVDVEKPRAARATRQGKRSPSTQVEGDA